MKTLLVLHGWGCNADVYASLTQHLSKNYNVFLPELPGFGETPEPSTAWGVSDYADYIVEYCKTNAVQPDVILCHSLGCRIAIKLLAGEVNPSLATANPPLVVFTGGAGIKPKSKPSYSLRTRIFKLKKLFLKPFPKAMERLRQRYGSADYRAASPIMRECLVKIVNEDLTPLLPLIKEEVLLIWGGKDDSTPLTDGKLMEKLIPNAGLAVMPNAGHYAFLEQPQLFCNILDSYLGGAQ